MNQGILLLLRKKMEKKEEEIYSSYACLSKQSLRRKFDLSFYEDHRLSFSLDADRVLHSLAYTRYIDKTQVFSLVQNNHITRRLLHVQMVSKIGSTIGTFLKLNKDLIEAIALAHDIGHPPFGHDGEFFLSDLCQEYGIGPFLHNIQSVHFLERIEKKGRGLNLSLQVLDGVLCHDGEGYVKEVFPSLNKNFIRFDNELYAKKLNPSLKLNPMTLEGCLVRVCDMVAYIGRDLEDAIRLGLVKRSDVPKKVSNVLGNTNGDIVYKLVEDLIKTSLNCSYIKFSSEVKQSLEMLKRFNFERIYLNPSIKREHKKIKDAFRKLFESNMDDLEKNRQKKPIFFDFLQELPELFLSEFDSAEIVRDYIASMTDNYFLHCYQDLTWPKQTRML